MRLTPELGRAFCSHCDWHTDYRYGDAADQARAQADMLAHAGQCTANPIVRERDALKQQIDDFWIAIGRSFTIEPREYFEKEYTMGFKSPLEMLAHWLWKREAKPRKDADATAT